MTASMRLRRYLVLLTCLALLGVATSARAQSSSGPTADVLPTSNGIKLGDAMLLHLGLGLELGWDSNVFYEDVNPHNSFYLRLNPSFDLTTRPREMRRTIEFDLHGGLGYVEYLTTDSSISSHRQFNVDGGLQAAFFNNSPYSFILFDNYVRSTMPPYVSGSPNLDRDQNEVGVRINLSPGGGRSSSDTCSASTIGSRCSCRTTTCSITASTCGRRGAFCRRRPSTSRRRSSSISTPIRARACTRTRIRCTSTPVCRVSSPPS